MKKFSLRSLSKDLFDSDQVNLLTLFSLWIGMVLLVNPIGNFPLNDDWAYGWTVKTFLETGEYRLSDWAAANLLPQTLWGTFFCLPFGFSFTALRLSTLVLGLLGVLLTYGLLREVGANSKLSLLGASVVALNPVYFGLSNSFSNDISSFVLTTFSLYLIIRGLKLNSSLFTIAGILISFVSILNRQSGIVILIAFFFALLAKEGIRFKTFILSISPVALGLLLQLIYAHWLEQTGRKPVLYGFQIENLAQTFSSGLPTIISTYTENVLIVAAYLGLFLLPFLAVCSRDRRLSLSLKKKQLSFLMLLAALAMGVVLVIKDKQMPLVGNVLDTFGVGPVAFDGYSSVLSSKTQILVHKIWKLLTLIAFASAALIPVCCIPAFREMINMKSTRSWLLILITASALAYFGLMGGLDKQYWFDRYLIFFLPILMMLIAASDSRMSEESNIAARTVPQLSVLGEQNHQSSPELGDLGGKFSVYNTPQISSDHKLRLTLIMGVMVILLIYGGFSIAATHDYLSWNRVRWEALNNLMETTQTPPEKIYGGFEFNGWHFGNHLKTCNPNYQSQATSAGVDWGTFDCLWGRDTDTYHYLYTLGFIHPPGYTVESQYTFKRWLPWRDQQIYVLKKA